jgi:hypothetical protein
MNAIVNLGNPLKDMSGATSVATSTCRSLTITGVQVFSSAGLLLTSPVYGAGMILDCLEELWTSKLLSPSSSVILIGSMGSLTDRISLGEIVFPNPSLCQYYGYAGRELHQDESLMEALKAGLQGQGCRPVTYRHGSSFAVFDPHTDHKSYTSSLYDNSVIGVDCGEVFIGLEFGQRRGIPTAAALYCSDSPTSHITDIGEHEFRRRAAENDVLLNTVAATVLNTSKH